MMDTRLSALCETCNIWMDGEVQQATDAADKHGLPIVLSAMKLLSVTERNRMQYPVQQFQDILKRKLSGV